MEGSEGGSKPVVSYGDYMAWIEDEEVYANLRESMSANSYLAATEPIPGLEPMNRLIVSRDFWPEEG